jgi:hypothetical protein
MEINIGTIYTVQIEGKEVTFIVKSQLSGGVTRYMISILESTHNKIQGTHAKPTFAALTITDRDGKPVYTINNMVAKFIGHTGGKKKKNVRKNKTKVGVYRTPTGRFYRRFQNGNVKRISREVYKKLK